MTPEQLLRVSRKHLPPPYLRELFPEQRKFVDDKNRTKAALCTRRAGKTEACARYLLREAERVKGSTCLYIALTRQRAKELLLPVLLDLDTRHGIGLEVDRSDLTVVLPNGSTIALRGADDPRKIERLRGGKYLLAIVDEAQSFPTRVLDPLIREIIRPALIDLRGTLCLVGTPGAACVGIFYDATTDADSPFSVHRWSVLDNPHLPHAAEELEVERKINHWTEDSPAYRREWRGQWVRDTQSIVYRYDRARNRVTELPEGGTWHYVIGIDYGVVDSTAYAVWGWRESERTAYLVDCWGTPGQTPTDSAEQVRSLITHYDPDRIVGDTGGLGKAFVEEARQRHQLPIEGAQKQNKRAYIELFNDALLAGALKIYDPRAQEWIDEALICQWDAKREREDAAYSNHRLDAALYGWRELKAFLEPEKPKTEAPEPNHLHVEAVARWERRKEQDDENEDWFSRRY